MATDRVKSKNLFNFRLQGFIDEDITAFYEKLKTEHKSDPEADLKVLKEQTEKELAESMRAMMDGGMALYDFYKGTQVVEVSQIILFKYNYT